MSEKLKKLDLPPVHKLHIYHISYLDADGRGQEFVIRSVNKLDIPELQKKKEAEINGAALASAVRSYKVNTIMPGGETYADISSIGIGKMGDAKSEKIPGMETPKTIGSWEKISSIKITYVRQEKIPENKLDNPPLVQKDDFTGKVKLI
jgi:hypothetical protein